MEIVQVKTFDQMEYMENEELKVNFFLYKIPAEKIISVVQHPYTSKKGEPCMLTTIVYKKDKHE
jgi:hypothetical protein